VRVPAGPEQVCGELGRGPKQVLAIVQEDEGLFVAQIVGDGLDQRAACFLAQSQSGGELRD
jgi:hypothetical protein